MVAQESVQCTPLSQAQERIIRAQLLPGEMLYWVGRESIIRYLLAHMIRVIFFCLGTGVAGWLEVQLVLLNPTILLGSLVTMLPAVALLVIFGCGVYGLIQEALDLARGGPDLYAITDRRALVIERRRGPIARCYGPESIEHALIQRHRDGAGNIIFERPLRWEHDQEGRSTSQFKTIGFFNLASVDQAWKNLEKIRQATIAEALPDARIWARCQTSPSEPVKAFYALEVLPLRERLFRIEIVGDQICGAKIAGSNSSTSLTHLSRTSAYAFLFTSLAKRAAAREKLLEAQELLLDPLGGEFLGANRSNFRLAGHEIERVKITVENSTTGTGYESSAQLEITPVNGKKRSFWLVRGSDPAQVASLLSAILPCVELADKI